MSQFKTFPAHSIRPTPQSELENYLTQQAQAVAQYEIDSTEDAFGSLYRVWGGSKGIVLLGTFYQNLKGYWVSHSCHSDKRATWDSSDQAIAAILGS